MPTAEYMCSAISNENCACVFIDDTGSQGTIQNIPHLPDDRYSWVGIVTPPLFGKHVLEQMQGCLELIEEMCGATEFHFADIYSKKGIWKENDVNVDQRIELFRAFSCIFYEHKFPIFSQTLWPGNSAIEKLSSNHSHFADMDISDPNSCALLLLLFKIRNYLEDQGWNNAIVVVDEKLRKSESIIKDEKFAPHFRNGEVWFAKSDLVSPIQLADFAAYTLNKWQVLFSKKPLSNVDIEFLKAVKKIRHLYQNVELGFININENLDLKP